MRRSVSSLLIPLFLAFVYPQPPSDKNTAKVGYDSITANDLRAHLMFLASPELEGRETTLRGQKVAAQYIAAVFRKAGLMPGGENGSFFQRFEVEVARPSEHSTISVATGVGIRSFAFRKDFLSTMMLDTTWSSTAVFVGAVGEHADSTTLNLVKGRIALAILRPSSEPRDTRRLPIPGALTTLVALDEETTGMRFSQIADRMGSILEKGTMKLPETEGRGGGGVNVVSVSSSLADEILKSTGRTLKQFSQDMARGENLRPLLIPDVTVTLDLRSQRERRETENVVGILEGSDPILKHEAVVFTAHYDHVGVGPDGSIFHGADDNGSGTSVLLELAEAFSVNRERPNRSLVFIALTGEEKGLLGSQHYVANPVVPLANTVANLNIDMVGRVDRKYEELKTDNYVYVIGSDKISTELDSLLRVANRNSENLLLDYRYNDDNDPQQFYRRSDHYNFARKGIPIAFFFTGIHDDYHRPTDTAEKILFDRMARIGRLIYTLGWETANFPRQMIRHGQPSMYH